jgi:hypothetical protein
VGNYCIHQPATGRLRSLLRNPKADVYLIHHLLINRKIGEKNCSGVKTAQAAGNNII